MPELSDVFDWIVRGSVGESTPRLIDGFVRAQEVTDVGSRLRSWVSTGCRGSCCRTPHSVR